MSISSVSNAAPWSVSAESTQFPDTFRRNAAILADNTGQYSQSQKLAAYQYITANWEALQGSSPTDKIVVSSALSNAPAPPRQAGAPLSDDAMAALIQQQAVGQPSAGMTANAD